MNFPTLNAFSSSNSGFDDIFLCKLPDLIGDIDGDGLATYLEIQYNTNASNYDSDSDGVNDWLEINAYSTNPLDPDTDQDGYLDGEEIDAGSNPLDPKSYPKDEKKAFIGSFLGTISSFALLILIYRRKKR